jgi:SNF2 family DNA or RNA helicase
VVRSTNFTVNSTDESTDAKDGSKLTKMIQTIKGIIADGDRMIIFAQFDDLIERIAQTMKRNGIQTVQVKGRVEEQVKRLKPFQTDSPTKGDPSVLLLKMDDEQSAGLNLTQLNHVLFVHPLLAPTQQQYDAYETQAIGRVRRFGQNKVCGCIYFILELYFCCCCCNLISC